MNPGLFIGTIIFYILSLAGSLLLAIVAKRIPNRRFKLIGIIHLLLIVATVLFTLTNSTPLKNYLTLTTVCSGVLLAGWALRSEEITGMVRIYFGAYLLTILLFLYSPSRLFYLISGNAQNYQPDQEISLEKNYFLVSQHQLMQLKTGEEQYKLIQKLGSFNKTINRDLNFGGRIDSVKVIIFTSDTVVLSGFQKGLFIKTIGIKPGMNKNTITRKSKR